MAEVLHDDAPGNHVNAEVVGNHGDDGLALISQVKQVDSEHRAAFDIEANLCCCHDGWNFIARAQTVLEVGVS